MQVGGDGIRGGKCWGGDRCRVGSERDWVRGCWGSGAGSRAFAEDVAAETAGATRVVYRVSAGRAWNFVPCAHCLRMGQHGARGDVSCSRGFRTLGALHKQSFAVILSCFPRAVALILYRSALAASVPQFSGARGKPVVRSRGPSPHVLSGVCIAHVTPSPSRGTASSYHTTYHRYLSPTSCSLLPKALSDRAPTPRESPFSQLPIPAQVISCRLRSTCLHEPCSRSA